MKNNTLSFLFLQLMCLAGIHAQCTLSNLVVEAHPCENHQVYIDFEFDYENIQGDSIFIVRGNGVIYDTLSYGQPSYTIGPLLADCNTLCELVIIDYNNENCTIDHSFQEPFCCAEECDITDVNLTQLSCDSTANNLLTFEVTFNYENVGPTNAFNIILGDSLITTLSYDLDFYSFSITPEDCNANYNLFIIDSDGFCEGHATLQPDCCTSTDCLNSNLELVNLFCQGTGTIATFDFDTQHPDTDSFKVYANNEFLSSHSYTQIPLILYLDDLNAENFQIRLEENSNCNMLIEFANPCLQDSCNLGNIEILSSYCSGDTLNLFMDFLYQGDSTEMFHISINDTEAAMIPNEDFPFYWKASEQAEEYEITITQVENVDCVTSIVVDNYCIADTLCQFTNLYAEQDSCFDSSAYYRLSFSSTVTDTNRKFRVRGNGMDYGSYNYGLANYYVGPVLADCETPIEFILIDEENENCSAEIGLDPACCTTDTAGSISAICAEIGECNFGGFGLLLDFEMEGIQSDFYTLYVNGIPLGQYRFDDLPLSLDQVTTVGPIVTIQVCESNNSGNCAGIFFNHPCQNVDTEEPCNLEEINYETSCTSDSTYSIIFSLADSTTLHQDVFINWMDNNLGAFDQEDFPISIDGIEASTDSLVHSIVLSSEADSLCALFIQVIAPDCLDSGVTDHIAGQEKSLQQLIQDLEEGAKLEVDAYDIQGRYVQTMNLESLRSLNAKTTNGSPRIILLRVKDGSLVYSLKVVDY